MLSAAQYARFIGVGAAVGVFSIACREFIDFLLVSDSALHYSFSVIAAYAAGIVVSYMINHRVTFTNSGARSWRKFSLFVSVALIGLSTTWLLSVALRYGVPLDRLLGGAWAGVAFAVATFLSTLITYPLNALYVFRGRERSK